MPPSQNVHGSSTFCPPGQHSSSACFTAIQAIIDGISEQVRFATGTTTVGLVIPLLQNVHSCAFERCVYRVVTSRIPSS